MHIHNAFGIHNFSPAATRGLLAQYNHYEIQYFFSSPDCDNITVECISIVSKIKRKDNFLEALAGWSSSDHITHYWTNV